MRVIEDELRLAREELRAVKDDLRVKVTTLDRVLQEALEDGSSVERLTEELGKLRVDHKRQEALANQRGEVIAELRDEAYTQWASGWLAFQRRASRAFQDLEFNIHLSDEEVEESVSEAEADVGTEVLFLGPLIALPCLMIFEFFRRPSLMPCSLGLCPLTPPASVNRGQTSGA